MIQKMLKHGEMQQRKITPKLYERIKNIWMRLRVFKGIQQLHFMRNTSIINSTEVGIEV